MATLTVGTRLGAYEILGLLGAGGMGEVYRARDVRLHREVAVKVLPAEVASDPDRLARIEREARTVAGLNHPNIVTLHSVEDRDGIRFLTMELVEGQNLADLVTPGGLPLARALDLGIAIAEALAAAHDRGVVHRDLKPANVMVTREGRVKVLDFGLAKPMRAVAPAGTQMPSAGATTSGVPLVMGTVPYMAPEQLRGQAVDARTDLFALGILLYELLAGRRPFEGASEMAVISAILTDTPEPLARVRSDLPGDLERIVHRCLEKHPPARTQSALEVLDGLRRVRRALDRGAGDWAGPRKVASIAVLPFVNRSASADDEYFSDGLADELLSVLSKIKGLRVTARTSSFQFRGTKEDVPTIGRRLDVATLLEGSVRKSGNRIRVSVQLVNVEDSSHLWSEVYDRELEDIFAVQDDIARSVVKELRTTLLGETAGSDAAASDRARKEVAEAARGRGSNPEAHRLHLLSRHLLDRDSRDDLARGIEYLNQALALDPAFALAWAELSRAHIIEADRGWRPVDEGYGRAREAIERSLALEPDLAEGQVRLGLIRLTHGWDWPGAEQSFSKVLALAPGNSTVLREAGLLAWKLGRLPEATLLFRRALEQDPLNPAAYHSLGFAVQSADRLTEAERAYREALELAPRRVGTRAFLSLVLLAQGRGAEALEEAGREPVEVFRLWALAIVHHGLGQAADSDAAVRALIQGYAEDSAYQIAQVYASRGEADGAFEWLERAFAQRDAGLAELQLDPHLRRLHSDSRWWAFLNKMGIRD